MGMGIVEIKNEIERNGNKFLSVWSAGRNDGRGVWGYVVYGSGSLTELIETLNKEGYKFSMAAGEPDMGKTHY